MRTSIDDLLSDETELSPQAPPPKRTVLKVVLQTVFTAASCAGAVWALIVMVGYAVPYLLLFMVFLAIVISWRLTSELRPPPVFRAPAAVAGEPDRRMADRPFAEASRWVSRLDWVRGDPAQFLRTVRPAIGALVDERLRLRHGITRVSHPTKAADLLGPRLVDFLDPSRLRRVPNSTELSVVVKELEEL